MNEPDFTRSIRATFEGPDIGPDVVSPARLPQTDLAGQSVRNFWAPRSLAQLIEE